MARREKLFVREVRFTCDDRSTIKGPGEAGGILRDAGAHDCEVEQFWTMTLDARHRVKRLILTSVGTVDASLVHPREIFLPALEDRAAAVLVAHNHPSGCTRPSSDDLELTRRLERGGELLGIHLLDHLIMTKDEILSLREHGWVIND